MRIIFYNDPARLIECVVFADWHGTERIVCEGSYWGCRDYVRVMRD